ncbi:MAG: phosphate uptake regulator PhoU [Candidatus Nitrosocaldus sp.]|nr:phosphate uptake regulator PhoU [Candidatus Nitrosocaldus sp.]MDW8000699.1 phosphate uptake regulator PhoU [Candidatus Nitrosocaldus sp.]
MRRLLDVGINRLSNLLHDMSRVSQECVAMAIDAYLNDRVVVQEVYAKTNQLAMLKEEVNDLAIELMIRYQPVAADLRFISSCMEVAYDLVRFGRYAYDIAQVREQFGDLSNCDKRMIASMSDIVSRMLRDSIDAFNSKDKELAERLIRIDDMVDSSYRNNLNRIVDNGGAIDLRCALSSVLVMRYLERIADHAVYIGELVRYMVSGERVR